MGVSGRLSGWQQLALSLSFLFHETNLNAEINNILVGFRKVLAKKIRLSSTDCMEGGWKGSLHVVVICGSNQGWIVCSLPTHLLEEGKN